jgi:hypothetical protein
VSERWSEYQRQTLEQLGALFTAPAAAIEELDTVYLQIIADHLIQLAAARFQQEGRGLLLVDVPGLVMPDAPGASVQAYYLSQAKSCAIGLTYSNATITQQLQSYNPRAETLVCITHAPKASLYRVKRQANSIQRRIGTGTIRAGDGTPAGAVRISRIRTVTM